jgi:hypothetical protein
MSKKSNDEVAEIKAALETQQVALKAVLENNATPIPEMYANGFEVWIGGSDLAVVCKLDSKPLMKIRLSPHTAKHLHLAMGNVIGHYEESIGCPILTDEEVVKKLAEHAEKKQLKRM